MAHGGIAALLVALSVAGCTGLRDGRGGKATRLPPGSLEVVASFYTLHEFARRIGGEHVESRILVPAGAEPHDFEPTARDVAAIAGARLLIYNGAGFEPWADKLLPTLPAGVHRVNATAGLPLVAVGAGYDPHVWLDPILAQRQADNILAGFLAADPARRGAYETNAAGLRGDLQALHGRYAERLASCRQKTLVTMHTAFAYLARRYGLTPIAIAGLSPEAELPPARLREVVRQIRAQGVRTIFFETLSSPRVAETIARETGARTLVLNPLEGLTPEQQAAGSTYLTVMDENLRQLADGLDCP